MKTCIYCNVEKEESKYTLEHIIPQFLGGASAPLRFKTRDVCSTCNQNLGLFVDGSFAKSWFVSNGLSQAALAAYTDKSAKGPPLLCLGLSAICPPKMSKDEVCETWLGPAGELVTLIRPDDTRFYWYSGGNPILAKRAESRAYFLFGINTQKDIRRTWLAFRDAFAETATKKIMCTDIVGENVESIGFSQPDALDLERIEYFRTQVNFAEAQKCSIRLNVKYDLRFLSKLALGVGYSYFGAEFLSTFYSQNLRKGIWCRDDDPDPGIMGNSTFTHEDGPSHQRMLEYTGQSNAVVLTLNNLKHGVALTLNITQSLISTILVATPEIWKNKDASILGDGNVIALYPQLQQCVELSLPDFLAHRLGNRPHSELAAVEMLSPTKPKLK